jgi:hypothetical protein
VWGILAWVEGSLRALLKVVTAYGAAAAVDDDDEKEADRADDVRPLRAFLPSKKETLTSPF